MANWIVQRIEHEIGTRRSGGKRELSGQARKAPKVSPPRHQNRKVSLSQAVVGGDTRRRRPTSSGRTIWRQGQNASRHRSQMLDFKSTCCSAAEIALFRATDYVFRRGVYTSLNKLFKLVQLLENGSVAPSHDCRHRRAQLLHHASFPSLLEQIFIIIQVPAFLSACFKEGSIESVIYCCRWADKE